MSVAVSNCNIPVDILEFKTEITHLKIEDAFLQKVTQDRPEEIIFLIFIGWFKTALTKQNNHFFCLICIAEMINVLVGLQVLSRLSDLILGELSDISIVFYWELGVWNSHVSDSSLNMLILTEKWVQI